MPSQLEEPLSRREGIFRKPHQVSKPHPQGSGKNYQPTTSTTSNDREAPRGVGPKLEDQENQEEAAGANANQEQGNQPAEEQPSNQGHQVMANNNVQGGQLSSIPMLTGT